MSAHDRVVRRCHEGNGQRRGEERQDPGRDGRRERLRGRTKSGPTPREKRYATCQADQSDSSADLTAVTVDPYAGHKTELNGSAGQYARADQGK